jgi:hypothetical protein
MQTMRTKGEGHIDKSSKKGRPQAKKKKVQKQAKKKRFRNNHLKFTIANFYLTIEQRPNKLNRTYPTTLSPNIKRVEIK